MNMREYILEKGYGHKDNTPQTKEEIKEAVKAGGFYGSKGVWNSLVEIDGKLYRDKAIKLLNTEGCSVLLLTFRHRASSI